MVRPILFNSNMVQAILEGRKTVTRRKIDTDISNQFDVEVDGRVICYIDPETGDRYKPEELRRYHPGDILYVRETWNQLARVDENGYTHYNDLFYVYKADKNQPDLYDDNGFYLDDTERKWRPSIHMPKEAARIWLQVTDVRAERLHNLTNRDAKKEGVTVETDNSGIAHRAAFMRLWDSTIKKSDISRYGWNANPWVWVIEFERCEKPEPCILRGVEPAEEKRPCIGYGDAWADEPCEMCKGCSQCTGNDEEAEG